MKFGNVLQHSDVTVVWLFFTVFSIVRHRPER
jgi:hypothetical protein